MTGLKAWREVRGYYGSFSEPGEGVEGRLYDDAAAAVAEEALKAGFVEVAESTGSDRVGMVQFRADNDTSVDAVCDGTGAMAVFAIELKNADQSTPPTPVAVLGVPSFISGNLIT